MRSVRLTPNRAAITFIVSPDSTLWVDGGAAGPVVGPGGGFLGATLGLGFGVGLGGALTGGTLGFGCAVPVSVRGGAGPSDPAPFPGMVIS